MKLGILTSIFGNYNFEQVLDMTSEFGLECMEVACWPQGEGERRYAGVCHIDCENFTDEEAHTIINKCEEKKIFISALGFYANLMDENLEKRKENIQHFMKVIDVSAKLNINMVTGFLGRMQHKTLEENLKAVKEIWTPIIDYAESKKVRIAIENCPMLFTQDEWPGGQNIMTSPDNWRKIFEILDSDYFGINYDPSHFVWQQMDYIRPLYEFKEKIFHVHFKDIKLLHDKMQDVGIMATPLQFMVPKLPGLGDVNWNKFVSALTDIGFDGSACIEIEDKSFEKTDEKIKHAVAQATRYMKNFV